MIFFPGGHGAGKEDNAGDSQKEAFGRVIACIKKTQAWVKILRILILMCVALRATSLPIKIFSRGRSH